MLASSGARAICAGVPGIYTIVSMLVSLYLCHLPDIRPLAIPPVSVGRVAAHWTAPGFEVFSVWLMGG